MSDCGDANGLPAVGQLIKDSVGADAQRIDPVQLASKCVASLRFALKKPQRILDRIDQWPVEFEQLPPSATGEDELGQRSAEGCSTLGQLTTKVGKGDRFPTLNLRKAILQSGKGVGVGENLSGLL
jgi:hypothetical protein